ncbi:DNA-binding NarL/FixJ family response regulator [Paenibacillus phyllosphaerae]|uniref:DNA-binding NarL/FixJ family response regulator n=1 Tax=Paenibacillus phyllosphaerae TaxID=274593 RepID=A0A7W5B4D8_9BACL|nr:helix-turn-helix transcriptional regulator [Paenibacillus phyllosphaerae]MBB3114200.1 DNA-binding NarL/FixJ family response regulator [Paenibacillus phyllosphaerae]
MTTPLLRQKAASLRRSIQGERAARLTTSDYKRHVIEVLRRAVPFDAYCFTSVDPLTLLSTGAVTESGVEAIHSQLFENEYRGLDYNRYAQLVAGGISAASLRYATEGYPELSERYRSILVSAGFTDELRGVCLSEGHCWGFLTLYRQKVLPPFGAEELALLSEIMPAIAAELRLRAITNLKSDEDSEVASGLVIMNQSLVPVLTDSAADQWMSRLRQAEGIDELTLPRPVRAVCTAALTRMAEISSGDELASVYVRMPSGEYVSLHASRLRDTSGNGHLSIRFSRGEMRDYVLFQSVAYGLSPREQELAALVTRGRSTKQIAEELHISVYTVQDHLKAIFAKTGYTSRRELTTGLLTGNANSPR